MKKLRCNSRFWKRQEKSGLFGPALLFFSFALFVASSAHAAVTEQGIRNAILGNKTFTNEQLLEMDRNDDGKVDVADLISLLKEVGPTIPVADFDSYTLKVVEGDNAASVKINFSNHFSGTLKYTVEVSGTATPGGDYAVLSGSIAADGLQVNIPITIVDDAEVEEKVETIELTIYWDMNDNLGYLPGASTSHTVFVHDNDSLWNGSILNNGVSLHFLMEIVQTPAGTTGALIGDGYGIIPKNGTTGRWPASEISLGDKAFSATIGPMLISKDLTVANTAIKRTFVFSADSNTDGHSVNANSEIRGSVIEKIRSDDEKQFSRDFSGGTFMLVKRIANIEPQLPALEKYME